jgi:hypothetical protein
VQSALGVGWRCREISVLATCQLQFAKAGSAAALSQQEKSNSADVTRGKYIFPALSVQWQMSPRGEEAE